VESPFLETFKTGLDKDPNNLI